MSTKTCPPRVECRLHSLMDPCICVALSISILTARTISITNIVTVLKVHRPRVPWVGGGVVAHTPHETILGPNLGHPTVSHIIPLAPVTSECAARLHVNPGNWSPRYSHRPSHIACGSPASSELMVPLLDTKQLLGVLAVICSPLRITFSWKRWQAI